MGLAPYRLNYLRSESRRGDPDASVPVKRKDLAALVAEVDNWRKQFYKALDSSR